MRHTPIETPRILHVLAQRPSLTGSGVTLDALVREADRAGFEQAVIVGVPTTDALPRVGRLPASAIHPLGFGDEALPFAVPGMSDVMPYPSTRYASMSDDQLERFRQAWRAHVGAVVERFQPTLIHAHHVWLLSAMLKDIAPQTPLAIHCHATGLRQLDRCPHLASEVRQGCARADAFFALHRQSAGALEAALGIDARRVHVIGAGYRQAIFSYGATEEKRAGRLLYVGKLSAAKGLPWLLDAIERLRASGSLIELHVAGQGKGQEAATLEARLRSLAPAVVLHGQLDQRALAALMRRCAVAVLPSMYEGLPLVLVEAMACGCRVVATALPGVLEQLAPQLGQALQLVEPPRRSNIDRPVAADLPAFVDALAAAIERSLQAGPLGDPAKSDPGILEPFTWASVSQRVFGVWRELISAVSTGAQGETR